MNQQTAIIRRTAKDATGSIPVLTDKAGVYKGKKIDFILHVPGEKGTVYGMVSDGRGGGNWTEIGFNSKKGESSTTQIAEEFKFVTNENETLINKTYQANHGEILAVNPFDAMIVKAPQNPKDNQFFTIWDYFGMFGLNGQGKQHVTVDFGNKQIYSQHFRQRAKTFMANVTGRRHKFRFVANSDYWIEMF